ncbi:MAG: DMT family transporter [Leptospirales bacterium]|nr:DMT family transporter [Leptospirales bacterium]
MPGSLRVDFVLLFCTLLWGATFSLVKDSLSETGPYYLNLLRFGLSALVLFPLFMSRIRNVKRSAVFWGTLLGMTLFAGFAAQTLGLKTTTAGRSAFLTQMLVIFTPIFQFVIFRNPVRFGTALGVLIVLPGLFLLLAKDSGPFTADFGTGDALSLACAIFYAFYMVILDHSSRREDLLQLVFIQIASAAICFALAIVFTGEKIVSSVSHRYLASVLYLAGATTLLTTYLQSKFQKEISAARAAILYSMEPVFATVFAFFLLGEVTGPRGLFGGAIILCGVLVSELWTPFLQFLRRNNLR